MASNIFHQELERRKDDLILVYNPLDEDFVLEWDRANGTKLFRFPSKKETPVVRYIAERFRKKMFRKIVQDRVEKKLIKENAERIKKGVGELDRTAKTGEQLRFESSTRQNILQSEGKKIASLIWVGVLQEFGVDSKPSQEFQDDTDNRAFKDKVWDEVEDRQASQPQSKGDGPTECDVCGFQAKSPFGLIAHKRSHRDEVEDKKKKAAQGVSQ